MIDRQCPPSRKSQAKVVMEKPSGPHQFARWLGLVKARKTNSCGAATKRLITISLPCSSPKISGFIISPYWGSVAEGNFPGGRAAPPSGGGIAPARHWPLARGRLSGGRAAIGHRGF